MENNRRFVKLWLQLNGSHALSVALDSLYGADLKANYSLEFYTTCIEIYTEKKNKKKLSAIKEEMRLFGINEGELKFGEDNSKITFDRDRNLITQLIGSIKDINVKCGEDLLSLSKSKKYDNFLDLLIDIKDNKILQSNQLTILICLDYFSEFGKSKYLLEIVKAYDNFYGRKQLSKDKVDELGLSHRLMERISTNTTAKLYKGFNPLDIINDVISNIENADISLKEKIKYQLEYLGYIQYKNDEISSKMFYITDMKFYGTNKTKPYLKVYSLKNSNSYDLKIMKGFEDNSFEVGDIIKILETEKTPKKKKVGDKYVTLEGQFNIVIKKWEVL